MIQSVLAFYPCKDVKATEEFYSKVIGMEVAFYQTKAVIFSGGKGYFGFVEYKDEEIVTSRLTLSLNMKSREDVVKEYERIVDLGATPLEKPCEHPKFPVFSFFIKDPDGYMVEFQKIDDKDL